MKQFNHANLLSLIGVCLPENASPQIIVPYMDRGDLHTFLRNHNASVPKPFRTSESDQDTVSESLQPRTYLPYLPGTGVHVYSTVYAAQTTDLSLSTLFIIRAKD